ncbi:eukaryotic translation initiation factor 3 subunit G [Alligator mississippiensis]|uniref:Eukaryotic translation initiation factor 3 subunit G n=1 Tax=Alligator mississippiensis TaxID=8496 RepID=A0A151PFQ0_ALLMI|nr:eukaryotic translation initiation factor 3 subunit G [Alligator mississippiensis]KYO47916.1 eukaryotic translation initiation factor 3 subunit G [Alligator mississippiensis]
MPTGDYDSKPSWADQVEEEGGDDDKCITSELLKDIPLTAVLGGDLGASVAEAEAKAESELLKDGPLPSPKELINGNIKTITEYREEEDGRKVKIIRTFRIETRKASKAVARRKNWKKFGNSEFDAPGPSIATTTVSDDVFMTFITSKEDLNCQEEEDPMNKLKGQKIVSCRICKGDHWTTRCPYKDTLGPMQKELAEQLGLSTGEKEKLPGEPEPVQAAQSKTGKYVPPSLRDGACRRGESMQPNRRADDNATIRVTNLSEDTRETDLQELFRPFGSISRIYLAKDKATGQSKGFAFISFHRREDAARAIAGVSGFGYDHLILNVEWAKPSTN